MDGDVNLPYLPEEILGEIHSALELTQHKYLCELSRLSFSMVSKQTQKKFKRSTKYQKFSSFLSVTLAEEFPSTTADWLVGLFPNFPRHFINLSEQLQSVYVGLGLCGLFKFYILFCR